ncbi:MAG TPA: hypothetical protein VF459_20410 [Caulobacteraceae bacterium]
MTLSDLATLSTAVSGIAVPVSLIYLAIQTHQNSRHTRALIQQGSTARTTQIVLETQNPERCAAWIEGNGGTPSLAEIRRLQFNLMCANAVIAMEDLYFQHRDGLMSTEQFERNCNTFRALLSEPGMRAHWNSMSEAVGNVAPKFRAFVDRLIVGEATEYRGIVI